jgi:hypothetical protein
MATTKLKLGIGALVIAGAATTLVLLHQSQTKLREENESFRQQIAQLKADNESLSSLAAQANKPAALPTDQFHELLRLRGEVGTLREQTADLARLRQENQNLLSKITAPSAPTNQSSAEEEDRFILRQTHTVDAMTTLLTAIRNYAANHNGQYPAGFDQLTASGDLATTNFAGNLTLDDFELLKDGAVDPQGDIAILGLRVPLQRPGKSSVGVWGAIGEGGAVHTVIMNVGSQ